MNRNGQAVRPRIRPVARVLRGSLKACAAALLLWLAGLLWFAESEPGPVGDSARPTDAIVVLTGGSHRVQSGLELLGEGMGRKLFVSGVDRQVALDDLLRVSGGAAADPCCIVLGHDADNTIGNARETARWIRRESYRSLRLVTAWYHMRRSLLEFAREMPEIAIVAHPVFPERASRDGWWRRPGTTLLIVNEYHKYLAALARPGLEALGAAPASWSRPSEAAAAR